MILANDQKIDYIRHIIRAESEVRFLRQLETYAQSPGNALDTFAQWMASRGVQDDELVPVGASPSNSCGAGSCRCKQ